MRFSFQELIEICNPISFRTRNDEQSVSEIITDSRKLISSENVLFCAISGSQNDGHNYLTILRNKGVKNFIIDNPRYTELLKDCNFLLVDNSLLAYQAIVAKHRTQFDLPVLGITGSNAKTIVKEWLFQLLSHDYNICKNPGSYNSQIGVPISVSGLKKHHSLALFEAGISQTGEMDRLQKIIQPTIGLFTNIGEAHASNFETIDQKIYEKLKLFNHCKKVVCCEDHISISSRIAKEKKHSWGYSPLSTIKIVTLKNNSVELNYYGKTYTLNLPFTKGVNFENLMHCIAVLLLFGLDEDSIQRKILDLHAIPMRLEVKDGIFNSLIINDVYNNDLAGLGRALEFTDMHHRSGNKSIILSDLQQSGKDAEVLYGQVSQLLLKHKIDKAYLIGDDISNQKSLFDQSSCQFFSSTEEFIYQLSKKELRDNTILIKGSRSFQFEKITNALEEKNHITRFEINLKALENNLNYFKNKLNKKTKIMAMVKAFAYGVGNIEVSRLLEYLQINYLGVAYMDEGIELRLHNITKPIMVMNPDFKSLEKALEYNLDLEVFSFEGLHKVAQSGLALNIQLKIDTGMHRLGFIAEDLNKLCHILSENQHLRVTGIFSHLAGADNPAHDEFTESQITTFNKAYDYICNNLSYHPIKHILNSAGIERFPHYQFDMVRLGIGLYGIGCTPIEQNQLEQIGTLKTTVSQIKIIDKTDSIGYNRNGNLQENSQIATIAIGYADGFDRRFSNGVGKVIIKGKKFPVIGNVCMDMTMIDIGTDNSISVGDEVIVYGNSIPVYEQAEAVNTISYELLSRISSRVKRVFYQE